MEITDNEFEEFFNEKSKDLQWLRSKSEQIKKHLNQKKGDMKKSEPSYYVHGKEVDLNSLELCDVYLSEWPQFESASISLGFFTDGSEMNFIDIDEFIESYPVVFHRIIIDSHY